MVLKKHKCSRHNLQFLRTLAIEQFNSYLSNTVFVHLAIIFSHVCSYHMG